MSKNSRLSDAWPAMCHGDGPLSCPDRCTEASVSDPARKSTEADRSNAKAIGSHSTSASKPRKPCTLRPPAPAISSTLAPNWSVFEVSARYPLASSFATLELIVMATRFSAGNPQAAGNAG